jgi:hypothetical protein
MLMTESQAAAAQQEWDNRDRLREEEEFNKHQTTLQTSTIHHERKNAYLLLSHYYRKKGTDYFDKAFECQYGMFTEELKGHMGPRYHPGLYFVKIEYGPYTCTHLRPAHTVLYTLEEALAQMPLPHKEPSKGLCGCWYDLIFNSDDEYRQSGTIQGNDSSGYINPVNTRSKIKSFIMITITTLVTVLLAALVGSYLR